MYLGNYNLGNNNSWDFSLLNFGHFDLKITKMKPQICDKVYF